MTLLTVSPAPPHSCLVPGTALATGWVDVHLLVHSAPYPKPFPYPHPQMRTLRPREAGQRVLGHTAGILTQGAGCPPHPSCALKAVSWVRNRPKARWVGRKQGKEPPAHLAPGAGREQLPPFSRPGLVLPPTDMGSPHLHPGAPVMPQSPAAPHGWPVRQERNPVPPGLRRGRGCKRKKLLLTLQMVWGGRGLGSLGLLDCDAPGVWPSCFSLPPQLQARSPHCPQE